MPLSPAAPLPLSLALSLALAPFATCGRAPATGASYDCPDGSAFTVAWSDTTAAVVTQAGRAHRLTRSDSAARTWTTAEGAWRLEASGDTASLARPGGAMRGCLRRNPELDRAGR